MISFLTPPDMKTFPLLRLRLVPVLLGVVAFVHSGSWVQGQQAADVKRGAEDARAEALLWLDKFLTESDLLRKEDVEKIHAAVESMPPSQLESWLEQTKELRAYVQSDAWQRTKRWLREFLRVQNIYSDAELTQLRKEIVNADADKMLEILQKIQTKHDTMVWMHQASEKNRAMNVANRDQTRTAPRTAPPTGGGNRPLFGGAEGRAASQYKSSKSYRVPGPLITSREVARGTVRREVFGGWGW
jgi:hypothetical protein